MDMMIQQTIYILFWVGFYHIVQGFPIQPINYIDFTAYPVIEGCPLDKNAWENASEILNCTKDGLNNRYHCMPNRHKTMLLEFCYPRDRVKMSPGFCFVLADNSVITKYPDTTCSNFINNSCPMSYNEANMMYKYPACLKINRNKGCYTSDPACPSVHEDAVDSTRASETTTIDIPGTSQLTTSSIENQGHPVEEENKDTITVIIVIVSLIVIGLIIAAGIIYCFCYKKNRSCTKEASSSEKMRLLDTPRQMVGDVEILDTGCSIKLLVCNAETSLTNGLHSIEWKKDGKIIQIDNSKYSGGDETEPSLVIHNASVEDAGNYQCEIMYGDEMSNSEAYLIDFPELKNGGVEILDSGSFKLGIAETSLTNGLHSIVWKKGGEIIQIDNSKYSGGDEREPSLVIHNASVEDAGNYHCVMKNSDKTSNITVFFIDLPGVEFIGTEIRGSNLVLASKVARSCVKSSIHWKKDDNLLSTVDGKFAGVDSSYLIIKDYNITDSGLYQCTLTNALGWSADCQYKLETVNICLVKASPMLPLCKKYKNIKLTVKVERKNENISMDCLTAQWQKIKTEGDKETVSSIDIDSAKCTVQSTQVDKNTRTYQLSIHQATEQDCGVYYCVLLDNACGKLESEKIQVHVVGDFYNKEEWKNDDRVYEEPEEGLCSKIITLLDKTDMVTLVGPPGVGKTFIARHIALEMEKKGWNIYQIFNMEELLIADKLQNSTNRLIVFDHPFGKTSVNVFNLVYFFLHKNICSQLFEKTKVIMTCRSDIFEEIKAFPIEHLKNIICMTKTYLGKSSGLLKEIFQVHILRSHMLENDDVSENNYLERLCNHIGFYFNDVQRHMYDFYALILLAGQGNIILKESLQCAQENICQVLENNISKENFTEGIKSAFKASKYLGRKRIGDKTVYFCKLECILDAFTCHILKNDPHLFFKCAENEVICSPVCPFSANTGQCWKLLDKEQYPMLSKNLLEYLTSDDMCAMSNVIKVPYWKQGDFIDVFMNVLSQNRMTEVLYRDRKYPIYIGSHPADENSIKTNMQSDAIWNETEMLRFELLFSGQWESDTKTCTNGFTVLSTNFVYWTISYGRSEAIDQILKLAASQNSDTDVDVNRCIMLACFRSVDVVDKVLQHLKKAPLTDVRYSKMKTLFFHDQATILPLHVAIARENLELVKNLVGRQVLINDVDHMKRSALLLAMEKNNTDIIEMLLKDEKVDVNTHDIESRYPLHLATMTGNENLVKKLLDKKAKVDCVDENDVTPLNTASTFGFKDIAEMLLKKGAKLNKFDNKDKSPLINALENGHTDVIGLLIRKLLNQKSMDLNQSDFDGKTPLFVAVDKCYFDTTRSLVKLGADVNIYDKSERTPLYVAAKHNSFELVKYLIEKGSQALVNKGDLNHKTPLHWAVENENFEMVDHLVKYGADVNCCNGDKTSLHMAVENFQNGEILELLLKNGAKVDIDDNPEIQSPLFLAIEKKNTEAFEILAKNKADLNKKDSKQRSVLCYAVKRNEEKIVRILLHKRVEIDKADIKNMTPLHYAVKKDLYSIVKLLVLEHADVNAADKYGRTPLHIASENGQLNIVEHLVRSGANVNKKDLEGDGPLEYAFRKDRHEIVMYLAKKGANLKAQPI